ncbi:MAG: dihydroneopterin aldolase [Gemmatimonadota bacterium]
MTDRILVRNLSVFAHHGVHDAEAELGQRFHLWLEARVDTREAGRSDRYADTVSYVEMSAIAVEIATTRRFNLLEALAEAVAEALLHRFPRIISIVVRVDKPSAPVPAILDGVSVEVERTRPATGNSHT